MNTFDETEINSSAWDWEADNHSAWARVISEDMIEDAKSGHPALRVTIDKTIPESWIDPLRGKHVLSLGGGGGQQTPLLAAFGCDTECADIS